MGHTVGKDIFRQLVCLGRCYQGVTSLKLIDGFMEVPSGINAKEVAVVHQGVRDGEALATPLGAGEKEIFASDRKVADSSFSRPLSISKIPLEKQRRK